MKHTQKGTRIIHWLMAALLIGIISIGLYMTYNQDYSLYALHKSLAVIALILFIVRLYWRQKYPWQSSAKPEQKKLVHAAHVSLLVFTAGMIITGVMYSGFGGYGVALFGLELIPNNYNVSGQAEPFQAEISQFGQTAHWILGYLLTATIVLHLLAAIKHHVFDKDDTLNRMLGR